MNAEFFALISIDNYLSVYKTQTNNKIVMDYKCQDNICIINSTTEKLITLSEKG